MTKKEMWQKIAELRNQRKTNMAEAKELRGKIKTEADKEQKKLMREKIKSLASARNELLAQVKEIYKQKAALSTDASATDTPATDTPQA